MGAEGHCAGRVEVLHAGQWGSVCDDGWGLEDAAVVCQELGCGAALAAPRGAFFGEGTGPIWLDNVRCQGNESTLLQCPAAPWSITDCQHREDAAVVCAGTCSVCQACAVPWLLGIVLMLRAHAPVCSWPACSACSAVETHRGCAVGTHAVLVQRMGRGLPWLNCRFGD